MLQNYAKTDFFQTEKLMQKEKREKVASK